VVDKYPQSRKLPDALLKIGYCDYELKQWERAPDTLAQVVDQLSRHAGRPSGAAAPR
jgi:TolA-binding protein